MGRAMGASGDSPALLGEVGEVNFGQLFPRRAALHRGQPVLGDVLQDCGELVSVRAGLRGVRADCVGGRGLQLMADVVSGGWLFGGVASCGVSGRWSYGVFEHQLLREEGRAAAAAG